MRHVMFHAWLNVVLCRKWNVSFVALSTCVFCILCSPSTMAFVGPIAGPHGYRPVGVFCAVCHENALVWQCYACGGSYCGRCIFQHRTIPGLSIDDMDSGEVSANEVAESMHILFFRYWRRLASELAMDPALANELYCRPYLCC